MGAVSTVGRGNARVMAALAVLALACTEPQQTEPDSFELASAKPSSGDPTVASADPPAAPQDTTLDVHVFGSNYDQGSKVEFARGGVVDPKLRVNATRYRTSTELIANVTVAPDAATVSYDIVVTKSTGKKGIGTEKFAVLVAGELLSAPAGPSKVRGISENGLVVGWVSGPCEGEPALWDQSGQLTILTRLPGTCFGTAWDANSAGVVVGSLYDGVSAWSNPYASVLWVPSGGTYQIEELPRLPDGSWSGASAINEAGWVASMNSSAVWSESTGWQVLQRPSGATTCNGRIAINDVGAAISGCNIAGRRWAVYWPSPTSSPVVLPLPLGALDAAANDINDAGVIVGSASIGTSRKAVGRAIRWIPSGSSWTTEILPDLGSGGYATDINDAGQMAGAVTGTNGSGLPVLWEASGTLRRLDSGDNAKSGGEVIGLAGAAGGSVVAGNLFLASDGWHAARWRP